MLIFSTDLLLHFTFPPPPPPSLSLSLSRSVLLSLPPFLLPSLPPLLSPSFPLSLLPSLPPLLPQMRRGLVRSAGRNCNTSAISSVKEEPEWVEGSSRVLQVRVQKLKYSVHWVQPLHMHVLYMYIRFTHEYVHVLYV